MFIGEYSLSVFFSYIGLIFNIISCNYAINNNIKFSLFFFMLSGLIDLFDGRFANLFKRNKFQKNFGVQIDTILDVFNFVAVPIFLIYSFGYNDFITMLFLVFYIFTSTMRLAYFNSKIETNSKINLYQGIPTTTIALYLPIALFLTSISNVWVLRVLIFIISLLFILNIKIIKPKSIIFSFIMIVIGLITFGTIFLFL